MHYAEQFVINILSRHHTAIKRISLIESHRAELEADGEWPDWCALPMAAVYSVLCEEYGQERLTIDTVKDLAPLTAAYIWRREKQIFSFDEDLFLTLIKQPFEGTLPSEILLRLPVPCVFVDMPFLISENDYSGFFAWIEYDNANKWRELRLLFISEDGTHVKSTPCPLLDTFDNSLLALEESAKRNTPDDLDIEDYGLDNIRNTVSHIINVLLYLCAEEPDYDRKPRKASAKPKYIADKPPRKLSYTVVGQRIGAVIRKGNAEVKERNARTNTQEGRSHASPVAHIRRDHWHRFWTGARDSADRKLVLKWIPPVFVCGNEEIVTTLHRVK